MIGKTISHYRIIEKLGEGGMGAVYKAEDLRLQRTVALKFLSPGLTEDQEAKEQFVREARAASALDHPNICTIYEIDETDDGRMFMAMAYYKGRTLDRMINDGPLPLDDALDIAMQACRGLMTAHEKGIVHRDIKSANIVVTRDGIAKILDFGLARLTVSARPVKTGAVAGTAAYMSPEQVRGDTVDHRSDIWSLGVVLYEMVTGRLPFKGDHEQAILYSVMNSSPKPVTSVRKKLPEELNHVLDRALGKDPAERYHDVRELIADLGLVKATRAGRRRGARLRAAPERRPPRWIVPAIVLLVLAGYTVVTQVLLPKETPSTGWRIRSLAVMPLENLSGDAGQDYFTDGMTEALISDVAKIRSLRVISRASAMTYRRTDKTIPEIAAELGVDAVVTGTVFRDGDRLRVTAQLIDATTDEHLWNESYELAVEDILSVQRNVARAIAGAIQVELTPGEEVALATAGPVNTEAHEAYLKGRYHWNKRTASDLEKSVRYFESAIAADPGFAPAHAGLAEAYVVLGDWGLLSPVEAYPRADSIAYRALDIEANLAEAYTVLGAVAYEHRWDWPEAERNFQRAVEINPNYATAHQWYAEFLIAMGRFEDALAENARAGELDPLSLIVGSSRAWILMYARDYDAAISQCNRTLEMDADFQHALLLLIWCYDLKNTHEEFVDSVERLLTVVGAPQAALTDLDRAYEKRGIDGARSWFAETGLEFTGWTHNIPYYRAKIYAELGDNDAALAYLEELFEVRSHYLTRISVEPHFDRLRSDPRYTGLVKRVGLDR